MNKEKKREIRFLHVFCIFVGLLVLMSILLLIGSSRIEKTVNEMQEITNEYVAGQNSISQMREVSDYLTSECQSFVATGNVKDAKDYFKEINVDKRREASLDAVEQYGKDDSIYASLAAALDDSNELAEVECYAMRLAAEGNGLDPSDISTDLAEVKLTDEDLQLSAQEQRQKSRNMVFDDSYVSKKNEIWNNVYNSIARLMENTEARELESYNHARSLIIVQNVSLIALIVFALILLLVNARMVILPMRESTGYIRKNEPLPVKGAAEYAYLARAYNRMLEKTQKHHDMLSYEATHDEMTSLYNRKFFDMKRRELAGLDTALMIVDVDYFKSINDNYGHEAGDRVLQKVSAILASSFRSEDFVCRIGGDEFAVIMVQMRPELRHVIEDKIAGVNRALREAEDDLPDVTLSIGVAFASAAEYGEGSPEDLFKKADQALYKTKEKGRNGYAFYEGTAVS